MKDKPKNKIIIYDKNTTHIIDEFNSLEGKVKNIIEIEIRDQDGNIVRKDSFNNTDTLVARCIVWENPWNYLNMLACFEDPKTILNYSDLTDVYKYFKVNYDVLLYFGDYVTTTFSRVSDNDIQAFLSYTNDGSESKYIHFIASYYDNKKVMFTYYLFDPPLEILPNYNIYIKYFIHIDKYISYPDSLITTNKQSINNSNNILEVNNVYINTRLYKYTRSFTKGKVYLGFDSNDYSSTVSAPIINIDSTHNEKKSSIISKDLQKDYHTYELYLKFLEDGNVNSTNALVVMCEWFRNMLYRYEEWWVEKAYQCNNSLIYNDKFNYYTWLVYDPLRTEYTNAFRIVDDSGFKVKTGHYNPEAGEFIETGEDIQLKPLKRSIIDFPLPDSVNILKEWFKLCGTVVNGNYSSYIGLGGWGKPCYHKNTWLTTFYSNIDKQLKYYLHWDDTVSDPYFYIVTNKEISQIDFNGTVVDNTTITPFYSETISLSEPYPCDSSNFCSGRQTQDTIYIYKIHLNDYIDVSSINSCKTIVSFTSQPQIVFCYDSNCFVVAIDCDEQLVNTVDTTGEDAIICRSIYRSYYFPDRYHKVKQYPLSKLNDYVAKISHNSTPHNFGGKIVEMPQLCFGSIIFNNTRFSASEVVDIKDNTNTPRFKAYYPVGNIIKDLDNDIVHVFGHTYWAFFSEYSYQNLGGRDNYNVIFYGIKFLLNFNNTNNFINILSPLTFPSYYFIFYDQNNIYGYTNQFFFSDRLKNIDISLIKSDVETKTINLFGKEFKMYYPITSNTQIGSLTIQFTDAEVSPTFVEGEMLGIICSNNPYLLITDSLEQWRIFDFTTQSPELEKNLYNYLTDYVSSSSVLGLDLIEKENRCIFYPNTWFKYWNDQTYSGIYEIEIPDNIYNTWNTLYHDPQSDTLMYRIIYFVEDIALYKHYYDKTYNDMPNIILFYPKKISTPDGLKEIEPYLVLLDNKYEVEFYYEHDIDSSNIDHVSGIGYIKPLFFGCKALEDIFFLNKNNFLIYVYFKEKGSDNPFIRQFNLPISRDRWWYKALFTLRNSNFRYGIKVACGRSYYYRWYSNRYLYPEETMNYILDIKAKSEISSINERKNILKWRSIQQPAFRQYLDIVNVITFGNEDKTIYNYLNVDPDDGNNKVIPKTFYLDASDFGEDNFIVITNGKDSDKEFIVYFGWAYPPENRNGNDISEYHPIINIEKIRNIIGDNFIVKDITTDNEISYWFVNGESFYHDTDTISATPTNYIMLDNYTATPRNYGSEYSDTTENDTRNNIGFRFSYRWDQKHTWNHVDREGGWGNNNVLQPTYTGSGDVYRSIPSNFSVGDNNLHLLTEFIDIFWHINPKTFLNNWYSGVNPSYYLGNPHPIPGFMPSYWLDFIIKNNKPSGIRLWAVKIVQSDTAHNNTTQPNYFGKIVDSQQVIEAQDTTGRVKVIHQQNRKLSKSQIKHIYSVAVHDFNKYYAQGLYDKDGNLLRYPGGSDRNSSDYRFSFVSYEDHVIRYIVKVENEDETETRYYHYDKIHNKWIDITSRIASDTDLINYGFDKFDLEIYGHKLNELIEEYMDDTDKLSFVIAMKNDSGDEYGFVEFYGISIEAEFNDASLYRELPWCWIDMTTHQLITDVTGKNKNDITIGIPIVPTHWIMLEVSTTGTPDPNMVKYSDRFVQLPLTVYMAHSSYNATKRYYNNDSCDYYFQNQQKYFMMNYVKWNRKSCQPLE